MNAIQQHIAQHIRGGKWDANKDVYANVSLFNMDCLVGMIETGEATYEDMEAVGGLELSATIAKMIVSDEDAAAV